MEEYKQNFYAILRGADVKKNNSDERVQEGVVIFNITI
jgi:hypothetical protein